MRYTHFFVVLLLVLASCQNRKKGSVNDVSEDRVFCDYRIWGEDGRANATLRLQYKTGDENGDAITWAPPAKVLLDGAEIKPDSSRFTGAYYELIMPVEALSGKHTIAFLDDEGNEHKENFDFATFSLAEEIPETVERKSQQIKLRGIPNSIQSIRLVMTDTSLYSRGLNEPVQINDGTVTITQQQLANLTTGPVMLEIYLEDDRPIKGDAKTGGTFSIAYGLKRELLLAD